MSIPFSRTMRSLHAGSFRRSLFGLIGAGVLLITWAAWFFLVPITVYETGHIVSTTAEGTVIADFPVDASGRIQPGQSAVIQLEAVLNNQTRKLSATVVNVSNQPQEDQIQIELYLQPNATARRALGTASQDFASLNLTGQVEVEVERVSPAVLVMRASGQFADTPTVSLSPQIRQLSK